MAKNKLPGSRRPPNANGGVGLVFTGLLAGIVVTALSVVFLVESLSWDWQRLTGSEAPNLIEAWRNIGLIALGAVGLGIATWRSIIAHRQNQNAVEQRRISERGLNVDRYQKGASMLESPELSVRIAGIYGLRELAMSDPDESYILVQSVLFAFIRETSKGRKKTTNTAVVEGLDVPVSDGSHGYEKLSADVYEALQVGVLIRQEIPHARRLETVSGWEPDLRNANLSDGYFTVDFSDFYLMGSDMRGAVVQFTQLRNAIAIGADFSHASFKNVDISFGSLERSCLNGVYLENVNLSSVNLRKVECDENTVFKDVWAWADRPPVKMPPEIEAAITYRDPAEREDGD